MMFYCLKNGNDKSVRRVQVDCRISSAVESAFPNAVHSESVKTNCLRRNPKGGDCILEVNGITGNVAEILEKCKAVSR